MVWTTVVSATELAPRIRSPKVRVLDVRHRLTEPGWGPSVYAQGRLPGAVHAHIDHDLSSKPTAATGRHPLPTPDQFRAACSRWGIDADTQVVVYDDAGGLWAARAWWLLKDYGHEAVALLDGGVAAWTESGGPLTREIPKIKPTNFTGTPGNRPRLDAPELEASLASGTYRLLDARAPERYRGDVEPIDPVAGHIPGARNLPAVSLAGPGTRLLDARVLRERLKGAAAGAKADQTVAYCGSGVTACHVVLAFEHAGLGPIRLYPGSWSEWIRDPRRPVEKGDAAGTKDV